MNKSLFEFLQTQGTKYEYLDSYFSIEDGKIKFEVDSESIVSDDIWEIIDFAQEHGKDFRVCQHCGKPFWGGYTDLTDFYSCEECFEDEMNECFPEGWRLNESGDEGENGGYYDCKNGDEWTDTGIFYTEW